MQRISEAAVDELRSPAFAAGIGNCSTCLSHLEDVLALSTALGAVAFVAPPDLYSRVVSSVPARHASHIRHLLLVGAIVVVAVAAAVTSWYSYLVPERSDERPSSVAGKYGTGKLKVGPATTGHRPMLPQAGAVPVR